MADEGGALDRVWCNGMWVSVHEGSVALRLATSDGSGDLGCIMGWREMRHMADLLLAACEAAERWGGEKKEAE